MESDVIEMIFEKQMYQAHRFNDIVSIKQENI